MDTDLLPEMLVRIFRWLAVQSPVMLVWVGGIVFAMTRWRRHPMVSLLTVVALLGLLLTTIAAVCISAWLPRLMGELDPERAETIYHMFWAFVSALRAVAWGAILVALFGWRTTAHAAPRPDAGIAAWEADR